MKYFYNKFWILIFAVVITACNKKEQVNERYISVSSQTQIIGHEKMLNTLPNDPLSIAEIASKQMIHHNNLGAFNITNNNRTPFPPNFSNILDKLEELEPYKLSLERNPVNRLTGACVTESYFLAGLLRYRDIPVRIRAGYFKNINQNSDHIIAFWEQVARYKGFNSQLMKDDPLAWKKNQNAYTQSQIDADHHIEHWICEYWNEEKNQWILLDANNDFLNLSSNIVVGYELPKKYFEYAHEAWINMRANNEEYNPEMHEEYPQDGRSHIRSQLLVDFYNLLNHDISCYSNIHLPSKQFVKEKTYMELTDKEILELDELASLLSKNPSINQLIKFYNESLTLKIESANLDSFSFVSSKTE